MIPFSLVCVATDTWTLLAQGRFLCRGVPAGISLRGQHGKQSRQPGRRRGRCGEPPSSVRKRIDQRPSGRSLQTCRTCCRSAGMSPGTQGQDTSSHNTTRVVC